MSEQSSSVIYVFDAYGTLFDVHSAVSHHAELVGPDAARVSEIWRNKQLEYSWTRAAMGQYKDFWELTGEALKYALQTVPSANIAAHQTLMNAYERLDAYEEVPRVLETLRSVGAKTAILSNGSPYMLEKAVQSAQLEAHLDDVFSVDEVMTFKTMPATYEMVTKAYQCAPSDIIFQSSNRWDIAGAASFGYSCNWVNRTGQADEYPDLTPRNVLKDLNGLLV